MRKQCYSSVCYSHAPLAIPKRNKHALKTSQGQKSTDLRIFLAHTHNCGTNMVIQRYQFCEKWLWRFDEKLEIRLDDVSYGRND